MSEKIGAFNLKSYLADEGLSLVGVAENGKYVVSTGDGRKGELNLDGVLADMGVSRNQVDIQFNAPDDALNVSPVSVKDREKLALGNTKGSVSYLKNRFEDASYHPDNGLVVKKAGVWHRVDPSFLGNGDAWEKTKELYNDIVADGAPVAMSVLASVAGAAGGTAVGGIPGALAGGAAGGAGAEALRTSLGRLHGTYEATPEEQLKDIGWEGLLNMGGEALALGAKPTYKMLSNSLKKMGRTASNAGKEMLSKIWGDLTSEGDWAFRRAMDNNADEVLQHTERAIQKVGPDAPRQTVKTQLLKEQTRIVDEFIPKAGAGLERQWNENLGALMKSAPENFSADIPGMMKTVHAEMAQKGYGVPVYNSEGVYQGLKVNPKWDVTAEMKTAMDEFFKLTNNYMKEGAPGQGKAAIKKLMDMKKRINMTFDSVIGESAQGTPKHAVVTQFREAFDNQVVKTFDNNGIGAHFKKLNGDYSTNADMVKMLKTIRNSRDPAALENLVKQIASKSPNNAALSGELASIAKLVPGGDVMIKRILDKEAAKAFPMFWAKTVQGGSATSMARLVGTAVGQANPRIIAKQIKYGQKMLEAMKNMGPKQIDQMLQNEQALQTFFTTFIQGAQSEDATTQQIMSEIGLGGGGQ